MTTRPDLLAAYRYGGRAHGEVPATTVAAHAATRPIHTTITGAHRQLPDLMANYQPRPIGVHARRGVDATDPAWIVAAVVAAVLLAALAVAVAW